MKKYIISHLWHAVVPVLLHPQFCILKMMDFGGSGCPIVGDTAYQPRVSLKTAGPAPPPLLLWAARITLPHPTRKDGTVEVFL